MTLLPIQELDFGILIWTNVQKTNPWNLYLFRFKNTLMKGGPSLLKLLYSVELYQMEHDKYWF